MQSKLGSLIEAIVNTVVGCGIALAVQVIVFPWYGLQAPLQVHAQLVIIFTVASIVRSYALRRLFNKQSAKRRRYYR
jgi:uncharacterized membrane protein